jgi:hypothetical protein
VPAAIYDRYWVAYQQAGHLGTTAQIRLPNERILAADSGLVASYAFIVDEDESEIPVVGPNGVTIIVRDIRTGEKVRSFETPVAPWDGVIAGDRLFWYANAESVLAPKGSDVAIWAIDLRDPNSSAVKVAPAQPDSSSSPLRLSDAGRVVLRTVVGPSESRLRAQIIDVSTLALTTIEGWNVVGVGGGRAVVRRDERHFIVIDVGTGDRIGSPVELHEHYKTFGSDGEVFVQFGDPTPKVGVYIVGIDLRTGRARELLCQGRDVVTTYLMGELSAPEYLVLFVEDWDVDPDGFVAGTMSVLDTATGDLQPDAFTIGPPRSPLHVTLADVE